MEQRRTTFRRGGAGTEREGSGLRIEALPFLRQLLRVRRLLRRLPGGRDRQARAGKTLSVHLRAVHRLRGLLRAMSVPLHQHDPGAERRRLTGSDRRANNERRSANRMPGAAACDAARARASANVEEVNGRRTERGDHRRQRGRRLRRLPGQRGLRDLSDHAVVDDGGTGRSMGERGQDQHLGRHPGRRRDAERGRCRRHRARLVAGRRADDHLHRVAGPHADDPQHVQDRGRTDGLRDPRRRPVAGDAGPVDLRRPPGRDGGAAHRLRPARLQLGPGSARHGA